MFDLYIWKLSLLIVVVIGFHDGVPYTRDQLSCQINIGMSSPVIVHQLGLEFELLKSILVSIPDVSLGVKMD